jgi:integrase
MTHSKRRVAAGLWQLKTNLFEIRIRVQHPRTRAWVARWRKFEGTRSEALLVRERWRQELLDEQLHPRRRETVASYATSWMSTKLRRGDLAPSTARKYGDALDLHVLPTFGDVLLDQLATRDVSEWLASKAVRYAPASCNSWLHTLASMLADAMADGLITHNAAAAVKSIRQRDDVDEDNSLRPDELRLYLDAWLELYPEFHALVLLLALTGTRWGEATSLKWSDIDEADKTGLLCIRRSHWCGRIKETKTGKRRLVPYPKLLADAMKLHRQRALVDQHPSLKGGWCFSGSTGKVHTHGRLCKENAAALKRAGINRRVTIHGLRRTMTDLLRLSAVDQVTAAALIGHDTERMRRHYSTVRHGEVTAAGDRVVRLVLDQKPDGRNDGRAVEGQSEKTS